MKFDRLELSDELASFVTARIASFERECVEYQRWLVPYVKRLDILPLWSDWFESFGIQSDGSIRKFSADGEHSEYDGLRPVENQLQFIGCLVKGLKLYPQLRSAVPQRPKNAVTCHECGGSGVIGSNVICKCGGIGWLYPVAA